MVDSFGATLSDIIGRYTETGEVANAVDIAEAESVRLAVQYPKGVSTGVTIMAANYGAQWVEDLLGSLITEMLGRLEGWDEAKLEEQEAYTLAVFRLLRAHAQVTVLSMFLNTPEQEEGGADGG